MKRTSRNSAGSIPKKNEVESIDSYATSKALEKNIETLVLKSVSYVIMNLFHTNCQPL